MSATKPRNFAMERIQRNNRLTQRAGEIATLRYATAALGGDAARRHRAS